MNKDLSKIICIWQPKFMTKSVLVAKQKVQPGKNYIFFSSDVSHPNLYSFDGDFVKRSCYLQSNGRVDCFVIPLIFLADEGELPKELVFMKEREDANFKNYYGRK